MTLPLSSHPVALSVSAEAPAHPLKQKSRFPHAEAFGFSTCPDEPPAASDAFPQGPIGGPEQRKEAR